MSEIWGVDVSSWQHPNDDPIDWQTVRGAGAGFALVKATQGTDYVSPYLKEDLYGARHAGLLVGAYHFFEEGTDPVAQANAFVAALMGERLELGVYIDWEPGEMTPFDAAQAYTSMVDTIREARRPVGIYTNRSWVETLKQGMAKIHRLWLADWTETTDKAGVFLWQKGQDTVAGIDGPVDVNVLGTARAVNRIPWPKPSPPAIAAGETPETVETKAEDHLEEQHGTEDAEPPGQGA